MRRFLLGLCAVFVLPLQAAAFELSSSRIELKYSFQEFPDFANSEEREFVATSATQYRHQDLLLGIGSYTYYDAKTKTSDRLIGVDLGYEIGERLYVSVKAFRFLDREGNQLHLLGEYSISPQTTVGAHYRDDRESDWSQLDLLFGHETENGTFGVELRRFGVPSNRVGFVEAFGQMQFGNAELSAFAGTGTGGNTFHRLGAALDFGVTDRVGLVGAIGVTGADTFTTIYSAIGANYQISERVRIEGLVGQERFKPNGRPIADGNTVGLKLVFETGAPRSLEDRLDIVLQDTWDRARAFD